MYAIINLLRFSWLDENFCKISKQLSQKITMPEASYSDLTDNSNSKSKFQQSTTIL
eukprot:jgi/Psemu1/310680/fgenesh1_kg.666_\